MEEGAWNGLARGVGGAGYGRGWAVEQLRRGVGGDGVMYLVFPSNLPDFPLEKPRYFEGNPVLPG